MPNSGGVAKGFLEREHLYYLQVTDTSFEDAIKESPNPPRITLMTTNLGCAKRQKVSLALSPLYIVLLGKVPEGAIGDFQQLRRLGAHAVSLIEGGLEITLLGFRDDAFEIDAFRRNEKGSV